MLAKEDGGEKRERRREWNRLEIEILPPELVAGDGSNFRGHWNGLGTELRGYSIEGDLSNEDSAVGLYAWVCILDARYRCEKGTSATSTSQAHKHGVGSGVRGNSARDDL